MSFRKTLIISCLMALVVWSCTDSASDGLIVYTNDFFATVDENSQTGTAVDTIVGSTNRGEVSYSITTESVAGAFSIDASSGIVSIADASVFDYETNPTLTVDVLVENTRVSQTSTLTVTLNDIFEAEWTEATLTESAGAYEGHQIVSFNGSLWLIGGMKNGTRVNEVWISSDALTWTQATTTGTLFPAISDHQVLVFDSKIWVIGGMTDTGATAGIWSSTDGLAWTQETTTSVFSARSNHRAVVFSSQIWVIGGNDGTPSAEIWSSSDGLTWTQVTPTGTTFSAREGLGLLAFSSSLFVIGGGNTTNPGLNDIWQSSDGITWNQVAVTGNIFSARMNQGTHNSGTLIWIVGGREASGNLLNDTWTSVDGVVWTNHNPGTVFTPREKMALFELSGTTWVNGGNDGSNALSDLWQSN